MIILERMTEILGFKWSFEYKVAGHTYKSETV